MGVASRTWVIMQEQRQEHVALGEDTNCVALLAAGSHGLAWNAGGREGVAEEGRKSDEGKDQSTAELAAVVEAYAG